MHTITQYDVDKLNVGSGRDVNNGVSPSSSLTDDVEITVPTVPLHPACGSRVPFCISKLSQNDKHEVHPYNMSTIVIRGVKRRCIVHVTLTERIENERSGNPSAMSDRGRDEGAPLEGGWVNTAEIVKVPELEEMQLCGLLGRAAGLHLYAGSLFMPPQNSLVLAVQAR